MRGRKPKPTKLKLIAGNPGKRPINKNEPKPQPIRPYCPRFLNREAKREWRRIVPELDRLGLLTRLDRAIVIGYCVWCGRWVEAEKLMMGQFPVGRDKRTQEIITHPAYSVAKEAMEQMRKLLPELGLTLSSRSRITVPQREDDFDEFLRRKG
ncbi:phage terminase small subunit P27 family [Candidatus Hakubella thermalkaliphila]|uniref:Phage terminase small subunit P27 family n=1 Tax=Candidatus Hakubella thermalkaliphila TaxID=2754717 RepID=A0A6V8QDW3_9ACTN|nr:phage terminase small subunit P27 family [Candidatus Hakubella thermalkaliphila]GFP28036.1 hypothetical protein HKBW3S33_01453 [Candidatus Hakubella thermalkaliphila]GFP42883.1 hypothetical protein HKBW3C_02007 [Candidatus Hakubella thermalkaliphila]